MEYIYKYIYFTLIKSLNGNGFVRTTKCFIHHIKFEFFSSCDYTILFHLKYLHFHGIGPLDGFSHRVATSICLSVCLSVGIRDANS